MSTQNDWERRRRWRIINASASEPANVIDSYDWDLAWDSKDATLTTWAGMEGTTAPTATALATPTIGLSTTGLAVAGISAERVDTAVRSNAAGGFATSTTYDWPGGVFHVRLVINKAAYPSANEIVWRVYKDGDENVTLTFYSANRLRFYVDGTGSAAAFQSSGGALAEGWTLIDLVYDPTGASGSGRIVYRENGVESYVDDDESINFAGVGGVGFYPGGGASTPMIASSLLFAGVRFLGSASEFTLAMHQADVDALGL